MKKTTKKILTALTALTIGVASVFSMASCSYLYKATNEMPATSATVRSNGGWVVEKGDYVYFINGRAGVYTTTESEDGESTETTVSYEENSFGDIVKGSICRVKRQADGSYSKAEVIVPLMVSDSSKNSGLFIYGDYIYYATPTVAKDIQGNKQDDYIDIKRSKLDGSETMTGYYVRSNAITQYRFVEVNGTVYCLYLEDGNLYSYKVDGQGGDATLLVKSASAYKFNADDMTDPYVYYTMGVTLNCDQKNTTTLNYNQIYRVRADATSTLTEGDASNNNAKKSGYRYINVKGYGEQNGEEYSYSWSYGFDTTYLQERADEDDDDDIEFSKTDVEDYPYVNLGQPVLDGIASYNAISQYNHNVPTATTTKEGSFTTYEGIPADGYNYALLRYSSDGIYFTRTHSTTPATADGKWTYYFEEDQIGSTWNPAAANISEYNDIVGDTQTKITEDSYLYIENGEHHFFYNDGFALVRADITVVDGEAPIVNTVKLANNSTLSSVIALDQTHGYLYYASEGDSAISAYRVKYDLTEDINSMLFNNEVVNIYGLSHITEWYSMELIDEDLFFLDTVEVSDDNNFIFPRVVSLAGKSNSDIYQIDKDLTDDSDLMNEIGNAFSEPFSILSYYFYTDGGVPANNYVLGQNAFDRFGDGKLDITDEIWQDKIVDQAQYGKYYTNADTNAFYSTEAQNCIKAYLNACGYNTGYVDSDGNPITSFTYNRTTTVNFADLHYKTHGALFTRIGIGFSDVDENGNYYYDDDTIQSYTDAWKIKLGGNADSTAMADWEYPIIWTSVGVGSAAIVICAAIPLLAWVVRRDKSKGKAKATGKKLVVDMNVDEDIDVYADDGTESEYKVTEKNAEEKQENKENTQE